MKVNIFSRKQIIKLLYSGFPKNTAVISYYGEGEKPVHFPIGIRYIRLNIDDLDKEEVDDPDNFHINDFKRVANFILNCSDEGMNIICQCQEGISRSAATAAAILEFYEQDAERIFADIHYYPNQIFYNNILRCLSEENERRQ